MLQQQSYFNSQIVVVDNASKPESVAKLRSRLPKTVRLIESPDNLGYAGGHALAVRLAIEEKFDFFWLLNNDVVVPPKTLQIYLEAYQQHGEAIYGTVPLTLIPNQPVENYQVGFHRKYFNPHYREIIFDLRKPHTFGELFPKREARPVAAVSGSSMFIPLSLVRTYGFMDERFFMYSEEIDYCFRLRQAGVAVMAVPDAYIVHERAGSSKNNPQLRAVMEYYRLRNQLVRIQRYGTLLDLLQAVIKNLMLLLFSMRNVLTKGYRTRLIGRAIIDGLKGRLGKTFPPESYI